MISKFVRLMTMCAAFTMSQTLNAQNTVAKVTYSPFKHYVERVEKFATLPPITSDDIVMLGNSLTENAGDWNKLLETTGIVNRGIGGDDATGINHRLVQILPGKPKAIFLMVGINDLSHNLTADEVFVLCKSVIDNIRADAPDTRLYVQSLLPINESFGRWKTLEGKTDVIPRINKSLKKYCKENNITYINLFDKFKRKGTNELRKELSVDGLHLSKQGYKIWAFQLRQYVKEAAK